MALKLLHNCQMQIWGETKILFMMACLPEYGPFLQKRIKPAFIGVGPVEAAINTTKILSHLQAQNNLPNLIISLGSAGSAKLQQTGLYQVSEVSWRDMDASKIGVAKGVTPSLNLPAILPMPIYLPHLPVASLSTGGNIVSGCAYDAIEADMVDMETYAILRSAQNFNVKVFGLRGISDGMEEVQHVNDWQQYLHIIDKKLDDSLAEFQSLLSQNFLDSQASRQNTASESHISPL